mmetsp:Transcript_35693/g.72751  ORF Transcript_35693/g.72751 Transcript_35693/m.72751 type:complete len:377 (-) Transcript_35693:155-1285(-)
MQRSVGLSALILRSLSSAIQTPYKYNKQISFRPDFSRLSSMASFENTADTPEPTPLTMIAMDMDGTLLDDNHQISQVSLELLQGLSSKGVLVVLATGRSAPAVYQHVAKLDLPRPLPVVCYNGASCRVFPAHAKNPSAEQKIVFEAPLRAEAVKDVLNLGESLGCMAQYYVGDDIFVVCKDEKDAELMERYKVLTGATHVLLKTYSGIVKERGLPSKVLLMTEDPDSVATAAETLQASAGKACLFTVIRGSPPFFVEFLDSSVCKGKGLERLCDLMGVPISQVAAFGDGDNDMEFLQISGLGTAMCNAREKVRVVADQVSELSNTEDGVAHELKKLMAAGRLLQSPLEGALEKLLVAEESESTKIDAAVVKKQKVI